MTDGLLHGVRVLDLTDDYGAYASRLLADLGAEVVRIEPADGGRGRTRAPRYDGISLHHLHRNTGKHVIDPGTRPEARRSAGRRGHRLQHRSRLARAAPAPRTDRAEPVRDHRPVRRPPGDRAGRPGACRSRVPVRRPGAATGRSAGLVLRGRRLGTRRGGRPVGVASSAAGRAGAADRCLRDPRAGAMHRDVVAAVESAGHAPGAHRRRAVSTLRMPGRPGADRAADVAGRVAAPDRVARFAARVDRTGVGAEHARPRRAGADHGAAAGAVRRRHPRPARRRGRCRWRTDHPGADPCGGPDQRARRGPRHVRAGRGRRPDGQGADRSSQRERSAPSDRRRTDTRHATRLAAASRARRSVSCAVPSARRHPGARNRQRGRRARGRPGARRVGRRRDQGRVRQASGLPAPGARQRHELRLRHGRAATSGCSPPTSAPTPVASSSAT